MLYVKITASGESHEAIRRALEAAGCRVDDKSPDVVVIEIVDGELESLRRTSVKLRDVPIVAIVPPALLRAALVAGAEDVIAEPADRDELVVRVEAAHRRHATRLRHVRRDRKMSGELRVLQREKTDLERTVCVDGLTGLANRRHTMSLLRAQWQRSAAEGSALSIVMIDLDCFHTFNAHYGHPGGDSCLRRVANAMATSLRRPSDLIGRYGGEEFLVMLADTDASRAAIVATRLREAVEALAIPHARSDCAHVVTITAGFASCLPTSDIDPSTLVIAADAALLAAKAAGRNRIAGDANVGPRQRAASAPWRRFPVVVAEPWFAARIPPFLESARGDARLVREAAEAGAFDRIRMIAKPLRSTAHECGFEPLAELASLLDQAARGRDAASTARVVDEIDLYLAHVQVTYRGPLDTTA